MVDPRASSGFSTDAAAYDRVRPGWPEAAVGALAELLALTPQSAVLDLGAGTGKLTRLLGSHSGRLVAAEPVPEMRVALRAALPNLELVAAPAEDLPLADASFDAVCVAEAFHWFSTAAAAQEIARVLRPGGRLALLWNRSRWDEGPTPWLPSFRALVEPHQAAAGAFPIEDAQWEDVLAADGLFERIGRHDVTHLQRLSPNDFVALVRSWSWIANMPASEQAALLDQVHALVSDREAVELRYVTQTHTFRRGRRA